MTIRIARFAKAATGSGSRTTLEGSPGGRPIRFAPSAMITLHNFCYRKSDRRRSGKGKIRSQVGRPIAAGTPTHHEQTCASRSIASQCPPHFKADCATDICTKITVLNQRPNFGA
jgi:hypothetical protein